MVVRRGGSVVEVVGERGGKGVRIVIYIYMYYISIVLLSLYLRIKHYYMVFLVTIALTKRAPKVTATGYYFH